MMAIKLIHPRKVGDDEVVRESRIKLKNLYIKTVKTDNASCYMSFQNLT